MAQKQFVFYLYKVDEDSTSEVLYRVEFEAGSNALAKRESVNLYGKWCKKTNPSYLHIGFSVWDKIIPFEQIDGRVVTGFVRSSSTQKHHGVRFKLRQCIYYEEGTI